MFNENDILVTHHNCMDGTTCALLFLAAGGRFSNVIFSSPTHEKTDKLIGQLMVERKRIFLADISISEKKAESIQYGFTLLDHHKTAIPLARFPWCHIDVNNERCGSKILYDYIMENGTDVSEFQYLVNLVDDRDRWINQYEYSSLLSELFYIIGPERFIAKFLENPPQINSHGLSDTDLYLIDIERQNKQKYISFIKTNVSIVNHGKYKVGFVTCDPKYNSDAGNQLVKDLELDAIILVGATSISVRVHDSSDFDATELVKMYSGGGHQKAAGFSLSNLLGKSLQQYVLEELKFPNVQSANYS